MSLGPDLAGRTFPPTAPFEVTHDHVEAFARSFGASYSGGPAPVTYPIVVAFAAMRSLLDDPAVGISLQHVVHGEQRFSYTRPVVPGDRLSAELTVASVRSLGGADIIATRSEITDADGAHVVTAHATLVHNAPADEPPADPPAPQIGRQR
jgi:acyl dehydratase